MDYQADRRKPQRPHHTLKAETPDAVRRGLPVIVCGHTRSILFPGCFQHRVSDLMETAVTPFQFLRSAAPAQDASATAAQLDRLADAELQHGHHLAAERLAWRAAELREAGR